jgi:hypothetical protein
MLEQDELTLGHSLDFELDEQRLDNEHDLDDDELDFNELVLDLGHLLPPNNKLKIKLIM